MDVVSHVIRSLFLENSPASATLASGIAFGSSCGVAGSLPGESSRAPSFAMAAAGMPVWWETRRMLYDSAEEETVHLILQCTKIVPYHSGFGTMMQCGSPSIATHPDWISNGPGRRLKWVYRAP